MSGWPQPDPLRVLVVEDDPMVASVNERFVARVPGFVVAGVARTGQGALAQLPALRPHLLLLDVDLPDMHGLALLKELRTQGVDVDSILITAAQDAPTVTEALRWGAVDYLIKPYEQARLRRALQDYRRRREELRSGKLSQSQCDRARVGRMAAEVEPPPKGLDPVTLQRIVEYLRTRPGPVSAQEAADALGTSRVTALR